MSRPFRYAALGAAALMAVAAASAVAAPTPDDPNALLLESKQAANARLGPWLGNLYQQYRDAQARGIPASELRSSPGSMSVARGTVALDAVANGDGAALLASLRGLGATDIRTNGPLVSARVPVSALGQLASDPSLAYARPVLAVKNALPARAISQGVTSMRVEAARTQNNVNGAGIEVGTLSDTFACNPPAFQPGAPTSTFHEDMSNGELPRDVQILANGACGSDATDEGRAMGQIIHDVAPGSSISFHTAFNGQLDFAEGILDLQRHGANVIVDDVRYLEEPFFMDGIVAQAVDIAVKRGVPYFSSAGNQARNSYQSAYRRVDAVVNTPDGSSQRRQFQDFDPGPDVSILQPIAMYPSGGFAFAYLTFQWDQPHRSATTYAWVKAGKTAQEAAALAKGARSDLDLVIYDEQGHVIRRCPPDGNLTVTCQLTGERNVGRDAVDVAGLFYANANDTPKVFYVALVKSEGPDPGVVKYDWFELQGVLDVLEFDTHSGTSFGHSNAASNIAVGAAAWYATVPFSTNGKVPPNDAFKPKIDLSPCAPACLNDFSSAGNVPIFFDRFGNRLAQPQHRRTPSVTGPDGGNTSFFFSDSSYDDDDHDGRNSPFSTFISAVLDRPGDEYPNFFGTSAAAPHVAAVAALMLDMRASLTPQQVRRALESTARPMHLRFTSNRPLITFPITSEIGPDGYDYESGFGLVDAVKALDAAKGM
jgi:subtilisin family serine protease